MMFVPFSNGVIIVLAVNVLPKKELPAIPIPPVTCNAPVVLLIEEDALVIFMIPVVLRLLDKFNGDAIIVVLPLILTVPDTVRLPAMVKLLLIFVI